MGFEVAFNDYLLTIRVKLAAAERELAELVVLSQILVGEFLRAPLILALDFERVKLLYKHPVHGSEASLAFKRARIAVLNPLGNARFAESVVARIALSWVRL